MAVYPFNIGEYVSLYKICGFVELSDWSSITFTGGDRQAFLHNFCTNDIRRLSAGQNCEAFITNVKGKILGHGLVSCRDDELVFTTVPGQSNALVAHFDRYVIREDVHVVDTTPSRGYLLLSGDMLARSAALALAPTLSSGKEWQRPLVNAAAHLVDIPVRWIRWDLLGPAFCGLIEIAKADMPRAIQAVVERDYTHCTMPPFHALRIEAGTPLFGVDFDDRNFPQEVGRNEQAISFTKGCYLGQETVARIDALGHVNQQIAGVRFSGDHAPEPGSELTHAGQPAGHVTSATFSPQLQAPLALAMLRREHAGIGSRLESPVGPCDVIELPVPFTHG